MNNLAGVTIKQFKDTLEEMRTVYPFTDEKTRLSNCADLTTGQIGRRVEISTVDERTGVYIIMEKVIKGD